MLLLIVITLLFSLISNVESTECEHFLHQSDFEDGTFRIKDQGEYCLAENIEFNPSTAAECQSEPNAAGCSLPTNASLFPGSSSFKEGAFALGFFAVITIESNDVTLDLNGYRIGWGLEFYIQQRFGSVIEIANAPFLPGVGPGTTFGNDSINTENVVVQNGIMGLTPHHGIHSNGASNVIIRDIHFVDFEVAAVQLNGFNAATMQNLDIGPSLNEVPLTGLSLMCSVLPHICT